MFTLDTTLRSLLKDCRANQGSLTDVTDQHPHQFLRSDGRCRACACVKALADETETLTESPASSAVRDDPSRAEIRIRFAEDWVKRFMEVLDTEVNPATRERIMLANGRACFLDWINNDGPDIKPTTLDGYSARVAERDDGAVRVEGNVIFFQFMSAAETGLPSDEGACLCPMVESKPAGLSDTYCQCSVGYVKQWYEMIFERPVEVELLDSVLRGGRRCKFKITVPQD